MSTAIGSIRGALATALEAVNGTGLYTYDLSTAGRVLQGRYEAPGERAAPCAMIATASVSSAHGPPLGQYERTATFTVVTWAPVGSDDIATRETAAEQLASDCVVAIERAVRVSTGAIAVLPGVTVLDVIVREVAFPEYGQGDLYAGYGVAALSVEVYYRVSSTGGL